MRTYAGGKNPKDREDGMYARGGFSKVNRTGSRREDQDENEEVGIELEVTPKTVSILGLVFSSDQNVLRVSDQQLRL